MLSFSLGRMLSQFFQRSAGGGWRLRRPSPASYRPRLRSFEERVVPSATTWIGGSLNGAEQWTGGDPTAWSNAANWTNGVPGVGDTPLFTDNISETYVVNGQTITHNGPQSLNPTVDQAFSVVAVSLENKWTGTVEPFAPLTLTGSSSWAGGAVAIDLLSSITNAGTFNISAPAGGVVLSGVGTFINNGTINELAGGDLLMGASVVLNNTSSGVYDFQSDVNIGHPSGFGNLFSEIINAGTFEKTVGTGTSTIGVALANSNAFTVETGTLALAIGNNLGNPVNTGGVFTVSQGATLDLTGGSNPFFTGTYTGSGAGTVLLGSGTLDTGLGGATFNLPGTLFQWTGGTLNANLGNLTNTGTMNIVANNQLLLGLASLVNQGTINESGSNFLVFDGGATLTNAAGGIYNFTSDSGIEPNHSSGQMNNAGTIEKTGGTGTSAISVTFDTSGNLTVQTGTLALAAGGGSLETGGVFTVASGATLDLTGGHGVTYIGTYTGSGAGTVLLGSGMLDMGLGGATFNLPGTLFQWTGGTLNANLGNLTNTGTMNIVANNQLLLGLASLVNQGTINESGSNFLVFDGGATLTNAAGGIYNFTSDSGIEPNHSSGQMNNAGTIEKTGGTGTSAISVTFDTSGNLTVQTGTLALAAGGGSLETGGVFTVASGATLDLTGGHGVTYIGTYTGSGAGTVLLGSGTLDTGLGGATFNLPGTLFQWTGGTLNANLGNLTNTGTMNIVANNQLLLGLASLVNQGTINESGSNFLVFDGGATLTNAAGGIYNFTSDSGIEPNHSSGQMNNAGTIEKTGGTGTSAISVTFDTSGNLTVQTGTLALAAGGGSLETGGVFTVASGATLDLTGGHGVTYIGTYTGSGAGTVLLGSGTLDTGLGGATFNLPGTLFQWTGGTLNANLGNLTNTGTMNIVANNQLLLGLASLVNQGTINESGSNFLVFDGGATLTNAAGGIYNFTSDSGIEPNHSSGQMNNAGTIEKTGGTGTSAISVTFDTSGNLTVQTGTLALAAGGGSLETGGVFTVASGATLDLTGGHGVTYIGTYTGSGAGTVLLGSGTLDTGLGGATFNLPGTLFQWTGGTLNANLGNLTNTGTMNIVANNQLLLGLASLVNQGTINESGSNFLVFDGGATLTNAAGGIYNFTSDSGIEPNHSSGQMNNAGTIEKTGGTG